MEIAMARAPRKYASFEPDKAIAAVGYLLERTEEDIYLLMKMMYLADRLHLSRYGRFIAGDEYAAMKAGPVPSVTYDLMKVVRGESKGVPGAENATRAFEFLGDNRFALRHRPDIGELSESDVECLEEVAGMRLRAGANAVVAASHDRAWAEKRATLKGEEKSCSMTIEDVAAHQDNADVLLAHLKDTHPGSA